MVTHTSSVAEACRCGCCRDTTAARLQSQLGELRLDRLHVAVSVAVAVCRCWLSRAFAHRKAWLKGKEEMMR